MRKFKWNLQRIDGCLTLLGLWSIPLVQECHVLALLCLSQKGDLNFRHQWRAGSNLRSSTCLSRWLEGLESVGRDRATLPTGWLEGEKKNMSFLFWVERREHIDFWERRTYHHFGRESLPNPGGIRTLFLFTRKNILPSLLKYCGRERCYTWKIFTVTNSEGRRTTGCLMNLHTPPKFPSVACSGKSSSKQGCN